MNISKRPDIYYQSWLSGQMEKDIGKLVLLLDGGNGSGISSLKKSTARRLTQVQPQINLTPETRKSRPRWSALSSSVVSTLTGRYRIKELSYIPNPPSRPTTAARCAVSYRISSGFIIKVKAELARKFSRLVAKSGKASDGFFGARGSCPGLHRIVVDRRFESCPVTFLIKLVVIRL